MHTHSGQLARWLGEEKVAQVSAAMRDFYWPVAVAGVPGNVKAMPGGDFTGEIRAGFEATALDRAWDIWRRMGRGYRRACRPNAQLNAGFSSLSDLIFEVTTNGKRQELAFYKASTGPITAASFSLFRLGNHPAAGAAAAAAPGGAAPTSATTGALIFTNPAGGDTTHITTAQPMSSQSNNTLLLYDRLFAVAKTASSTATEAVTGVPTRYQSTTPTDPDYAGGNFMFPEVGPGAALGGGAHNWTVCQYTDQDGNAGATMPSSTGISACHANRIDVPLGTWFFPLAAGDFGVQALTQMQNSASITGALDFVIGHALAFLPCPIANVACTYDGINSTFGLARVFDDACLCFLELIKPTVNTTNFACTVLLAAG